MIEEKLTKKEMFIMFLTYVVFIGILAFICIFKNEIWEFAKFIFSNLYFILKKIVNFLGEDNIVFFTRTILLIIFTIFICIVWGLFNFLSLSLFVVPIFVAIFFIFNIDINLENFYFSYLIFLITINGIFWSKNQKG